MNFLKNNIQNNSNIPINETSIYSIKSNGKFFSPFSLNVDEMEYLILINFEKDPDEFYNVFELQKACDKNGDKSFLVIAYRNDGATDVYYQSKFPFGSQATILNDVSLFIRPLKDAKFDITNDKVEVCFTFEDKIGREIKVNLNVINKSKSKSFFLLAPIGVVTHKPISLPVYSLHDMLFAKQKYTDIEIVIDKIKHNADSFLLPIDCAKNYFTRYSSDTFNVDWNKNFDGSLFPLKPDINNKLEDKGINYKLINNDGHFEIECMRAKKKEHFISINFSPPFPDIACLKTDINLTGNFIITTDKSSGLIQGEYQLHSSENVVKLQIQPNNGWQPNEKRLMLRFLFIVVKIFKEWPKSYIWNAIISFNVSGNPVMKSSWRRIKKSKNS